MNTISQGRFTSTGLPEVITIPSDCDWMKVYNVTTLSAGGAGTGVEFYWQRGMSTLATPLVGFEYKKLAADDSMSPVALTSGGFTLVDSSSDPVGSLNATITAVSAAAIPVVSATDTHTDSIAAGDVVRFINVTGAQQLGGIDFTVDTVVLDTSFRLPYMAQIVAGTTGSFRKIKYAPLFYPRARYVTKITAAAAAVVTLSVTHGYSVGQQVSFEVPSAFGMTQMNGRVGTITAVNTTTNTVTLDIDSSAFTAFAWPVTAFGAFTPAMMLPVGEAAKSPYGNLLDDAWRNTGYKGIILAAGVDSPAGIITNEIFWIAGKSDYVTNN